MVRQGCRAWCVVEWRVEGMELGIGRADARRGISRFLGVGPRDGRARDGPGLVTAGRLAGAKVRGVFEEGICVGGMVSGRGGGFSGKWSSLVVGVAEGRSAGAVLWGWLTGLSDVAK